MAVSVKEIKQLVDPSKNFRPGTIKSQDRLNELGFDPIGELVMLYRQLQNEDKLMCALRDGTHVPLNPEGKSVRYSYVAHMTLLSQLEKISSQLLRYGYGRVPETINIEEKTNDPLIINLVMDKEEEGYLISDDD